jgi:O-antigen/teichoic acid export membrane protein
MPPVPVSDSLARRETAVWQGAAASVVAKAVSLACLLAQVPLAVGYLGTELFGLWMTLTSVLAMMAFADLGLGASVQNEAAAALGRDRPNDACTHCSAALAMLSWVGAALALTLLALWKFLPWTDWLGIHDLALASEARRGLAVLIALFCLTLPLTSVGRVAYGLQLGWLASAWYAAINVLTLAAVAAASGLRLGFASFVAAAALPPLVGHVLLAAHLFKKLRWRFADLPRPTAAEMRALLRVGCPFVAPQLVALALSSAPTAIIASVLGPAAVTPYALSQRLLSVFGILQQIFLNQLWPAYTEARTRGDRAWLRKTYARSCALSIAFVALPQSAFVVWGSPVTALWTSHAILLAPGFALACGVQAAAFTLGLPSAFLLNSEGRLRAQTLGGLAALGLALGAMPAALAHWGIESAPWILAVAWAVCFLPWVWQEAAKSLRASESAKAISTRA